MGAWGYGILQNDAAQDSMCEVANRIESDIASLPNAGSEEEAAKVGAATGLLLQFSPYSFNPENDFSNKLIGALSANREFFVHLPGNSAEILNQVIDGRGSELAERDGEVDPEIEKALHSDENEEFIMQKAFSVSERDLFRHPVAVNYVQPIFDRIVAEVDEGFENDELVSDLSREAEFMGAFALLLILPSGRVNPEKFNQWRDRFRRVWEDIEPIDDEIEKEFAENYNRYLELAFQCGAAKFMAQ